MAKITSGFSVQRSPSNVAGTPAAAAGPTPAGPAPSGAQTSTGAVLPLTDFYAMATASRCFYIPGRDFWPNSNVDARIAQMPLLDDQGREVRKKGKPVMGPGTLWLARKRSVASAVWAPGYPI
jgi:hypothetical protein